MAHSFESMRCLINDYINDTQLYLSPLDDSIYDHKGRLFATQSQLHRAKYIAPILKDYLLQIDLLEGRLKVCL